LLPERATLRGITQAPTKFAYVIDVGTFIETFRPPLESISYQRQPDFSAASQVAYRQRVKKDEAGLDNDVDVPLGRRA
jgi:hypothetical protein